MHPDWNNEIARYCSENSSSEPEVLQELVRFTWLQTVNPRQLSGHLQGRFLSLVSKLIRPTCILEIGTFTGYSAFCLAEGLQSAGVLHTIEADAEIAHKAEVYLSKTPLSDRIKLHVGEALSIIPDLNIQPELIFVDAEKQQYQAYTEICLPLMESGGIILFDNTLWSMKVLDKRERENDADTRNMHAFNQWLTSLPEVEVLMLPLRDGLTMLRKK
ncbi:MAG: class I SAM-dependent methyltransferase [Bacteroidetes bacterium]|nr:class I SAM-dependent methyltransferase [Bacteroidota bacterium]